MDSIWIVTNINFPDFVMHHPLSVLYFWSDRYSGDRYMKYRLKHLSIKYPKIKFGFINIDLKSHHNMANLLGIKSIPSLAFFLRGSKERVIEGPMTLLKLSRLIVAEQKIAERRENIRMTVTSRKNND